MYGKIFESIYEGSLYGQWEAIVTFQQMIVLSNQDGVVDMTPQAIAARTSIPLDIISKGLKILHEPDRYSRSPACEGRRIELIDPDRPWGWRIVNHDTYRKISTLEDKRAADRDRMAAKRANSRGESQSVAESRKASSSVANVAHTDTDTDTDLPPPASLGTPHAPPDASEPKGKASRAERATRIPEDFTLTPARLAIAQRELLPDPERVFTKFRNHWRAKSGAHGRKVDWEATWQNWCIEEADRLGRRPAVSPAATKASPAERQRREREAELRIANSAARAVGIDPIREGETLEKLNARIGDANLRKLQGTRTATRKTA